MAHNQTIPALFAARVAASAEQPALHFKHHGAYQSLKWSEVAQHVWRTACGLVEAGVQPGDRVILVSENRWEWIIADLAIQFAQAVHTPVHAPLTGEQIAWQIRDSGAQVVILSTPEQANKLTGAASLPGGLTYFAFDECSQSIAGAPVRSFSELSSGRSDKDAALLAERALSGISPDSLATILYTSGTTGEPKGVMLTQNNLTTNALAALQVFDQQADDMRLTFLPLSHIFARTCDLYTWIAGGCQLALAESRETVLADAAAIRPTVMNAVPYFFDKVRRGLGEKGLDGHPTALRQALGGRIRLCCSGGAALPEYLFDYFLERGVPILQGYGLTESSPVITASTMVDNKRGCAGKAIPDVEVAIAADGEILTRGPHVMLGYYKNPTATEETIRNGWLCTGDLGEVDSEGFLRITGRKKELIVTSGGKNIAPVYLESLLTQDPLILQAMVIGDDRSYLTALIVPNPDVLRAEIASRKIPVGSPAEALSHPDVQALFQERIGDRLACVAPYEQVRKFKLLPRGFTIEHGELTAKLSLRRKEIAAHFAAEIDAMYGA